jgi:hypothetical protein
MAANQMSKNLREMSMSSKTLNDVRDTQQLKGEATKTKAEGETNSTTQYYVKGGAGEPKGGENGSR